MFRPNPGKANFPPVEDLQTEIRSALRQSADPAVMPGFSLSSGPVRLARASHRGDVTI